jgi:hypothetical protein
MQSEKKLSKRKPSYPEKIKLLKKLPNTEADFLSGNKNKK